MTETQYRAGNLIAPARRADILTDDFSYHTPGSGSAEASEHSPWGGYKRVKQGFSGVADVLNRRATAGRASNPGHPRQLTCNLTIATPLSTKHPFSCKTRKSIVPSQSYNTAAGM